MQTTLRVRTGSRAVALVALLAITSSCAATRYHSNVTFDVTQHVRAASTDACVAQCEAVQAGRGDQFAQCVERCPQATVLPGACTAAESSSSLCVARDRTFVATLDAPCSEAHLPAGSRVTACKQMTFPNGAGDPGGAGGALLGGVGVMAGVALLVLMGAAGSVR